MRAGPVHIDLRKHRKRHAVIRLTELADLLGAARLLLAELVAGETQHREALRAVLLVELLQSFVLRREPAFARGVDDQEHLALVIGEARIFAGERLRREVVDGAQRTLLFFARGARVSALLRSTAELLSCPQNPDVDRHPQHMTRNSASRYDLRAIAHQAMLQRGLEPDFSDAVLRETKGLAGPASASGDAIRDWRHMLWASIDNDDSRDLDQLSVAEPLADGQVRILVAVADVD